MSTPVDCITMGEVEFLEFDEDPRNGGGYDSPLGSLAIFQDEGNTQARYFKKTGPLASQWTPIDHFKFFQQRRDTVITTSTTFQTYTSQTFDIKYTADYKIQVSYIWNHDSNGNDFEGQLLVNGGQEVFHKQEPQDSGGGDPSGSTQRFGFSYEFVLNLAAGSNTFDLQYRTDSGGTESTIFQALITVEEYIPEA